MWLVEYVVGSVASPTEKLVVPVLVRCNQQMCTCKATMHQREDHVCLGLVYKVDGNINEKRESTKMAGNLFHLLHPPKIVETLTASAHHAWSGGWLSSFCPCCVTKARACVRVDR